MLGPTPILAAAAETVPHNPESFSAIGWILVSIAGAVVAIERIQAFIRRSAGNSDDGESRTIKPSPLRIEAAPRYVDANDYRRDRDQVESRFREVESSLSEMRAEFATIRREIHQMQLTIMDAGEKRASHLHERINLLIAAVGELKGRVDGTPLS